MLNDGSHRHTDSMEITEAYFYVLWNKEIRLKIHFVEKSESLDSTVS
jgi:hypothetical protein